VGAYRIGGGSMPELPTHGIATWKILPYRGWAQMNADKKMLESRAGD
jgi:hypothetical protein